MPRETAKIVLEDKFLRSRDDDRRMAELAREQYGVVGREQLAGLGVGDVSISRRLRAGRLHQVFAGVYSVGYRTLSREGRWLAAVLASGEGAVLSHWSAAALWRIRPNSRTAVDVTASHKSRSWDGIRRHHKALPPDEIAVEKGIPVTTAARTIFDLAATEHQDVVEAMVRELEYRRLWSSLSLVEMVDRYRGRRGVRRVRAALETLADAPAVPFRSRFEEDFTSFLRLYDLPRPRFNDWILLGARRYQVDCHWPGTGQIVELDGWRAHGTRTAFQADRTRDRALSAAGYSVTRVTWHQLQDEPEAVAADLRALLTRPGPASLPARREAGAGRGS
jgi:very-short-patch-repair endonuclease/predicted transcriptional regulator of viral defense system